MVGIEGNAESVEQVDASPKLVGIGGWLVFPAIGLILGAIMAVVNFAMSISLFSQVVKAGYGTYLLIDLCVQICLFAYLIIAAQRFFGKKRSAPETMIRLNIAVLVASLFTTALAFVMNAEPFLPEEIKGLIKGVIAAAIWIPYFKISKRCQATFTN